MLYLVQWSVPKLQPIIQGTTKPGNRIVSHNYGMDNWAPVKLEESVAANGKPRTLYLWIA